MTLLAKARQHRRIALAARAAQRSRPAAPAQAPLFRSRREAANIDRAPLAMVRAA
ncbi:MAG TPA: hypothetical protein PKC84_09210 [Paracoccaceae bacterium]|nr:hypothetical protein [Paracoccaceae bacterium]